MTDTLDPDKIVRVIRAQNWKLGGILTIDHDEAVALIEQALAVARSEGERIGMERMHASHMRVFDESLSAGKQPSADAKGRG